MRAALVVIHRYVGLVMAGFLLVAGLTGSLLVWNDELEALISPRLFSIHAVPGAQALDPLVLRAMVAARYPEARVTHAPLRQVPNRSTRFLLFTHTSSNTPLANNQVFVHPVTGEVLGERRWGDLSQGFKNLMPFIYRLHYSLALGTLGSYAFGVVALLWTLDCFVGAYLTFPARRQTGKSAKSWAARWLPAWKIRWGSSAHKLNFDLHRCSGLWPWAMLFVLAWSSVAFNLTEVYKPIMSMFVDYQPSYRSLPLLPRPQPEPDIGWFEARSIGRSLMKQAALEHGFLILQEEALAYDPSKAVYRYDVLSSLDPRDQGGATSLYLDAVTGEERLLRRPTGAAAGDTVRLWLAALHMAAVWGWRFRVFMCLLGLTIVLLAVSGVLIWWKKRVATALKAGQAAATR